MLFFAGVFVFYSLGVIADVAPAGVSVFTDPVQCWNYDGNYSLCSAQGGACNWANNSGNQNSFCPINTTTFNTTWGYKTGNLTINIGCCSGGGQSQGCFTYDGNQNGCQNDSTCDWKPNNANQNPWCPNAVGCCQKKGCWSFAGANGGNNASCTTALGGNVCRWANKTQDPFCPDNIGCCIDKSCEDATSEVICNDLKNQLNKPCQWTGSACQSQGGGFGFYNNTDSCLSQGGWWNGTGCATPGGSGGGGGGGGFLFAQEARCWFADNRPSVCLNVSGCVYCSNVTRHINNASSACYNQPMGFCQGHEPRYVNFNGTATVNITDINTSSMTCGDIRAKQTCQCGPLPNCVWSNSSASTGNYCTSGVKSDSERQACQPPVQFCEDGKAKNNQTMCEDLANLYMMPCKWDNSTVPAKNCTFNSVACFGAGSSAGGFDYNTISSETQCLASGGTWKSEYYNDGGVLKQDAWCEKGALFSFVSGKAFGNKGNCNTDCWACEFNSTGGVWANVSAATSSCLSSQKGVCRWKNDSNAPNGLGWCNYPSEFNFGGAKDCNVDCKGCEFAADKKPEAACTLSPVGCTWKNDSNALYGGFCFGAGKKSCNTDCFSCYDQLTCSNSSFHITFNCSWDPSYNFCKPFNFAGEICFNGKDDDSDSKSDCSDPDCSFDQFCGGGSIGNGSTGVDCKKITNMGLCRDSKASGGKNCTVVTPTWGGAQYCDFPGANCWQYESNVGNCTPDVGCVWKNSSSLPSFQGFCEINKTRSDTCFNSTNSNNQTRCDGNTNCQWIVDSFNFNGGRCEFKLFASCGNRTSENTCCSGGNCNANGGGNCTWRNDSFSFSGGFCDPICFQKGSAGPGGGLNSSQCSTAGASCSYRSTTCEPEMFSGVDTGGAGFGGCHNWDNNYTGCLGQNLTCGWKNFSVGNMSQGACDLKGQQQIFAEMDKSPPKILGFDSFNDTSQSEVDIMGYGIKDMTDALAFGIVVKNITLGAVCKGYYLQQGFGSFMLGNGNATTKFYVHLDTNKNTTDGCNGTYQNGSVGKGYEFLIKYVVTFTNGSVVETKSFHRCSGGNWALTNVPLGGNRDFMCGMNMPGGVGFNLVGGVMVLVDKESLESFSEYNKTAPMRVFVSSANESLNENTPADSVSAPGFYTQGSADFKFVDCSNPDTKDDKCKNFQKFGFNVYEDCKNGKDDDGDGLSDCSDPKCGFTPGCAGAGSGGFNFSVDVNDKTAPSTSFTQVDLLHIGAFVKFDTNEPANGTLGFYGNDSSCSTLNKSIDDLGDPGVSYDNFKPFHLVPLEQNTLGYDLTNGTTYYYKTTICDPSGNCADSACLNLTTKSENAYKNFIFKMKLPSGYNVTIPALNYSGNFTTNISGKVYESGIKTNASVTKNINVTVNCNIGSSTSSLTLVGVDIFKPKSIDLTTAFVCDSSNNVVGMNSSAKSWNQVVSDLGMGGYSDYLKLTFPVTYSSSNNISWCDDALTNCTAVNDFATCSSGGSSKTDCKVPTSLGFSAYKISTPGSGSSGSSPGGGGGGGAAGAKTYSISSSELSAGYTKTLAKNDKVKFNIDTVEHSVTVSSVSTSSVTVVVASHPQSATLAIGASKKFDVDDDNVDYDVQVTINSATGTNASITIKGISEVIAPSQPEAQQPAPEQPSQPSEPTQEAPNGGTGTGLVTGEAEKPSSRIGLWLILAVVIIVAIAWAVVAVSKRKR